MLLFDVLKCLKLSTHAEVHAYLFEEFVKILSDFFTCKIISLDCVRESVSFINWNCARNTITRI